MLVLTRKSGQIITIQPHASLCPATPIAQLFANGPIEIVVTQVWGNAVRLGIQAHSEFFTYRRELEIAGVEKMPRRGEAGEGEC